METKRLTDAQQRTLLELNTAAIAATGNMERFVAYLRDEHAAPAPAWVLTDIRQGFVKATPPAHDQG